MLTDNDFGVLSCGVQTFTYYFIDHVDRLREEDYVPSNEDMFAFRKSTTAAPTLRFQNVPHCTSNGRGVNVSVSDLGGQVSDLYSFSKHS